jgi:hypothetical protein
MLFGSLSLSPAAFAAKSSERMPLPHPQALMSLLAQESLHIQIAGIDRDFGRAVHAENLAFAQELRREVAEIFQERSLARR